MSNTIGPYEIIEQIGSGGMATVYKAHQPRLGRAVAVKVLHQMFVQDSGFLARFEREAKVIARLDHPNIVPIYDYDDVNGQPYLVMKFLEGKTLKEILAARTLPLEDIRRIMIRVADALTYAHEMGVLHRDIKPSNIMLDDQGSPYLMDFGLARIAQQGESTLSADTMLGTPQYISPEQAQGLPNLDARTDVYSLGVILYELVAGRVPFVGESAYAIVHKHIYAAPPAPSALNPEVPPAVDAVLLKALAKDPADRYPTPNALSKAFEQAITASGLEKLDESRVENARVRGENLTEHTPGGGKYVSIPAAFPGSELKSTSFNQMMHEIGDRFRTAFTEVKVELEKNDVVGKFASGVREVATEVQEAISSSGAKVPTGQYVHVGGGNKADRLIQQDWGTDPDSVRRRVKKRVDLKRGFFIHLVIYVAVIIVLGRTQPQVQEGLSALFNDPGFQAETGQDILAPLAALNWAVVVALMWGAGVVSHAIEAFYETGRRYERRRRAFLGELQAYYGPEWEDEIDARSYKRIRKRVKERFKRRTGLLSHFVSGIMLSLAMFVGWSPVYETITQIPEVRASEVYDILLSSAATIPVLFSLLMMITVFIHATSLSLGAVLGGEANEKAIVKEMERERELSRIRSPYRYDDAMKQKNDERYAEKPKNTPYESTADAPRVRLTGDGEFTESFIDELEQDEQQSRR